VKSARIRGSDQEFPIGKILCIGRNYAEHIRELGNEPPEAPVVFMKPASSVVFDGGTVVIPPYSADCHHEAELALLIGKTGKNIPEREAADYLAGFGVAIDLTLRDVQAELKKKGLPWDIAKGFDTACPLSTFAAPEQVGNPQALPIRLSVNGSLRQDGNTAMMIHSIPKIVSYLSEIFTLEPGDVILTGTPAGVGPLKSGDDVIAEIPSVASIRVRVL